MGFFENRSGVYVLVHEHRKLEKSAICSPLWPEYQQTWSISSKNCEAVLRPEFLQ
jgi:hypothetical protein